MIFAIIALAAITGYNSFIDKPQSDNKTTKQAYERQLNERPSLLPRQ